MGNENSKIIDNLIEQGKATGSLTTKEITNALERVDYDLEQMDVFYETCNNFNIKIIDDIVPDDDDLMNIPIEEDLAGEDVDYSMTADA